MNRTELQAALRAAGVNSSWYEIEGVPSDTGLCEGRVVVARTADGRWFFGSHERGVTNVLYPFDSEAEACAYAYGELTRLRPAPRRLTPEEEAESREITRRQVAKRQRTIEEQLARRSSDPAS